MIYYVVTEAHRYTIDELLARQGGERPVKIRPLTYEEMFRQARVGAGIFIFSDLERLTPGALNAAARVWNQLAQSGRPVRLLNNPKLVLKRYELLCRLHERGVNCFSAYRLADAPRPRRYPVFIRRENDHRGSLSDRLYSEVELEAAARALVAAGKSRRGLLAIEFCGSRDDRGFYRKYAAFCIRGTVIPRALAFSRHWVVKRTAVKLDDDLIAKEHDYLISNPHERQIREAFEIARADFGRADYAVIDGRVQIYEVNTNPTMYGATDARHAMHFPDAPAFTDRLLAALTTIDAPPPARALPQSLGGKK